MTQRHEVRTEENRYSLTRFVQYLTKNCDLTRVPEGSTERGLYKSNTSHIELSSDRLREELIRCQYLRPTAAQVFAEEPALQAVDPVAQRMARRRVLAPIFREVEEVTVPTLPQ
jgi:hypothetical protein